MLKKLFIIMISLLLLTSCFSKKEKTEVVKPLEIVQTGTIKEQTTTPKVDSQKDISDVQDKVNTVFSSGETVTAEEKQFANELNGILDSLNEDLKPNE